MNLGKLSDLHDALLAMRLLREEILDAPVTSEDRSRLAAAFLRANASDVVGPEAAGAEAVAVATCAGRELPGPVVSAEVLSGLAGACGGSGPRTGPGLPFLGTPAPPASRTPTLFCELLETVNGPVAVDVWPPPVRAFALHFLLRLVQPFSAPAAAVAFLGEVLLLTTDGFAADRMLLAPVGAGVVGEGDRPDPSGFVRARTHGFVEALARAREQVRRATARGIALACLDRRTEHLNPRQRRLIEFLAEVEDRTLAFRSYVRWSSGRHAPSLRTLQRDWQQLRDRGWIDVRGDEGAVLRLERFSFG